MLINAYLTYDGRCEEAFGFYQNVLGGKIAFLMRYGESPMGADLSEAAKRAVIHARFVLGDQVLMGCDALERYEPTKGMMLTINLSVVDEAERIFTALAEGGTTTMPIAETFWAQRFGMLTDKFGIPWMINCEKP